MDWKVPAAGAALGLLFSLLGGLIGRIGFGDLIFRSILAALLMGGIAQGLRFLLGQFTPELFENTTPKDPGTEDMEPGRTVDISVGEGDLEPQVGVFESSGSDDVQDFGADLADMGPLSGTSPSYEAPETQGQQYSEDESSKGTVDFEGRQEDPAILARAVQTVMKREGES